MVTVRGSGQNLTLCRKNKSAGLLQGKTACFPLWRAACQVSHRQSPFSAKQCARPLLFYEGHTTKSAVFVVFRIDDSNAICSGASPAARRDFFLLLSHLLPLAKDFTCKLSALRTVHWLVPQKQIGRTSSGENSLFSPLPLANQEARRQSPFSAKQCTHRFCFMKVIKHGARAVFDSEMMIRMLFGAAGCCPAGNNCSTIFCCCTIAG